MRTFIPRESLDGGSGRYSAPSPRDYSNDSDGPRSSGGGRRGPPERGFNTLRDVDDDDNDRKGGRFGNVPNKASGYDGGGGGSFRPTYGGGGGRRAPTSRRAPPLASSFGGGGLMDAEDDDDDDDDDYYNNMNGRRRGRLR